MFYFVRHGKTDYSERNTKIYQGFGVQLSKLSQEGVAQIQAAAQDARLADADLILSSPYTRAVQTAAILSKQLGLDLVIETDLHEWLANQSYTYEDDKTAERAYEEYVRNCGRHASETQTWEEATAIRERVIRVLKRYASYGKVIVAGHGMMIQATTGKDHPQCGEIVEYHLE